MKLLISVLSFCLMTPAIAGADYLDVITNKLNDGCSLADYQKVVEEFRGVMKSEGYDYTVEIAVPLIGPDLDAVFWVGRTKDLATFGTGNQRWTKALANPKSAEAKVSAKLGKCAENVSRTGSLTQ